MHPSRSSQVAPQTFSSRFSIYPKEGSSSPRFVIRDLGSTFPSWNLMTQGRPPPPTPKRVGKTNPKRQRPKGRPAHAVEASEIAAQRVRKHPGQEQLLMEFPLQAGPAGRLAPRFPCRRGGRYGIIQTSVEFVGPRSSLKAFTNSSFSPVSGESVISAPAGHFVTVLSQPRILTLPRSRGVVGGEGV